MTHISIAFSKSPLLACTLPKLSKALDLASSNPLKIKCYILTALSSGMQSSGQEGVTGRI